MRRTLAALLAAVTLGSACGSDTPTEPDPIPVPATVDVFIGTLAVGGSSFYSFTMFEPGGVHVLVATVRRTGTNVPVSAPLTLGIGRPQGTGCSATEGSLQVTPALSAQHKTSLAQGVYCVNLSDPGTLGESVDFLIRIIYPVERYTPTGTSGSDTFASTLLRGGSASRSFGLSKAGTLTARLTGVTPASNVGLVLGVPALVGGGCLATIESTAPAGITSELSAPVDGGDYCVAIIDRGQLTTESVTFSLEIIKP